MLAPKFDPLTAVVCPVCGWVGSAGECHPELDSLCQCPKCGKLVVRVEQTGLEHDHKEAGE